MQVSKPKFKAVFDTIDQELHALKIKTGKLMQANLTKK